MFANVAVVLSTLVAFAAAGGYPGVSQCNTNGGAKCCNQVVDAKSATATYQATLLGINISHLTGQIAFGCKAVSVIDVAGGVNCASAPVCCQGNDFNGLVNVGCNSIPIAA